VRRALRVGWDCTTESVELDLLVGVVELEDRANAPDNIQVLIAIGVEVMQRIRLVWRTVGESEVNLNRATDCSVIRLRVNTFRYKSVLAYF